jgi:hypothetical protein
VVSLQGLLPNSFWISAHRPAPLPLESLLTLAPGLQGYFVWGSHCSPQCPALWPHFPVDAHKNPRGVLSVGSWGPQVFGQFLTRSLLGAQNSPISCEQWRATCPLAPQACLEVSELSDNLRISELVTAPASYSHYQAHSVLPQLWSSPFLPRLLSWGTPASQGQV